MAIIEIDIDDYISEYEKKEIAADVFRDALSERKSAEIIITNSAYHVVREMMETTFNKSLDEMLSKKVREVIEEMSEFTVFATRWGGDKTVGQQILEREVRKNASMIESVVKDKIKNISEHEFENLMQETFLEIVSSIFMERVKA